MTIRVFEKYEIIRRIAVGGMGEIFLARQTGVAGFDRLVILKSLLPDLAREKGFIDQFLDEARVAATLNHPNIVAIYEVGLWQGVYFIAMEYIKGVTLAELLMDLQGRGERVPIAVAARIVMDAAVALDHAHFARTPEGHPLNIVHRDISPQNIMVRDDGVTKVLDFGIAKAANRAVRTATGAVKGKLTYMPPEQLSGKAVDGRSDQFALGVCLWEMCATERLFHADNPLQTVQKITQEPIPRLVDKVSGFPPELDRIVQRMLSRAPEERYPRCRDAATDLRSFLELQSREVAETEVSDFVNRVMGADIQKRAQDLTPKQEDFLLHLRDADGAEFRRVETPPDGTVEVEASELRLEQRGARYDLVAAIAMIVLVLGGLAAWQIGVFNGEPPPPVRAPQPVTIDEPAPEPPPVTPAVLRLTSKPPGARIFRDGELVGETDATLTSLGAGQHTLELKRDGFQPETLEVELIKGETVEKTVVLARKRRAARDASTRAPAPRAEEVGTGEVRITTKPDTQVLLLKSNEALGSTPLTRVFLAAGKHRLRFVNEQQNIDEVRQIDVRPDRVNRVRFTF